MWSEKSGDGFNVYQVLLADKTTSPVPGGYSSGAQTRSNRFSVQLNLSGVYTFIRYYTFVRYLLIAKNKSSRFHSITSALFVAMVVFKYHVTHAIGYMLELS